MARRNRKVVIGGIPAVISEISNDLQWALVKRVASGESRESVGRDLGISDVDVDSILTAPMTRLRFKARMQMLLLTEGAPIGYRTLTEIASNPEIAPHVRRLAASDLLARAGFGPAVGAAPEDADKDKAPSELSTDDLRVLVDNLKTEIAYRAKDVTPQNSSLAWLD